MGGHVDPEYAPDFKVYLYFDEIDFVEVKRARKVKQPPTAKRLDSIKDHLETLGFNYCVRTEKEIRSSNQVIHNCVYLNPYKWRSRDRVDELKNLVPKGPVTFLEWAEKIGDAQAVVEMMAHQLVFSDFYQRLTSDTVIRPIQDCDFAYMYA